MSSNLDSFIDNLQEEIFEDAREAFGEKVYQRGRRPLYMQAMDNPYGHADLRGGCGPSVVCGSYAAEMALGKTADELLTIDGKLVLKKLGGLPEENEHCAHLAAESLHAALDEYMRKE